MKHSTDSIGSVIYCVFSTSLHSVQYTETDQYYNIKSSCGPKTRFPINYNDKVK